METGENSVLNLIEKSSTSLTNNNNGTIQLNGTTVTDDHSAIHKDISEFVDTNEQQNNINKELLTKQKPNVFELIGGNKNCDSEGNDNCDKKTILNNNDVSIGFVDDDDDVDETKHGTRNNDDATTFNHCNSIEATQGLENNCG